MQSLKQLKRMEINTRYPKESLRCYYTQMANINLSDITIIYISFSTNVRCFEVFFLFTDKDEMLQKQSVC